MPAWVSEGSVRKYNRAVALLTKEKKDVSEEAIKALYVQWGGLVLGDVSSVQGVEVGDEEAANARAEEADAPVIAKRPKKAK